MCRSAARPPVVATATATADVTSALEPDAIADHKAAPDAGAA